MKGLDFYYYIHAGGFVFVCMAWYSYVYGYLMLLCSSYFTGNLRKHQCVHVYLDSSMHAYTDSDTIIDQLKGYYSSTAILRNLFHHI